MGSSVIDLQDMITSPGCDVVTLLRRAHIIAYKLELKDFDQWISYELNGYPTPGDCPDYRKVRGVLRANRRGTLIPVIIPYPEIEDAICEHRLTQSLSELISLCDEDKDGLVIGLPGKVIQLINQIFSLQDNYVVQISRSSLKDIAEKVKNIILDWTIELEKADILEARQFSDKEKQTAKSIHQTISKNINFSYDAANKTISEIEAFINNKGAELNDKDKDDVLKKLSTIKKEISQKKKASVIKDLLDKLEMFLVDIGKSSLVALIQISIQHLFLH